MNNSNEAVLKITGLLREAIRVKHYSYSTERSYVEWAKRFYAFILDNKKDIHNIDSNDVKAYLSYLAVKKGVSSSTQNQAFNALLFLCRDVLKKDIHGLDTTVRAKRGPKLPVVLTAEEVKSLFKQVKGKNLLLMQLLYGTGMRLMEVARLRVQDIDFQQHLIFVRSSKGDKDRTTILPDGIIMQLQNHLQEVKQLHEKDIQSGHGRVFLPDAIARKYPNASEEWKWQYVFPSPQISTDPRSGIYRRHHLSAKSIQNAVKNAVTKAGINKLATVHTLRHSFATHLLQDGVNIREIQELLGHKHVETTSIYTHVLRDITKVPRSPLDKLLEREPALVKG